MKIGLFLPYPLKSKPTTNNFTPNTEESIDGAWNTVGQIDNIKGNFCWTGEWFLLILQEQKMTKDTNRKKSVSLYLTKCLFPIVLSCFSFPLGLLVLQAIRTHCSMLEGTMVNLQFWQPSLCCQVCLDSWPKAIFFAIYAYSQITCYEDLMKG